MRTTPTFRPIPALLVSGLMISCAHTQAPKSAAQAAPTHATQAKGGNRTAPVSAGDPAQVPIPKTAAEVPGPVAGNTMTKAYVQFVGRMAYMWGYPMVNRTQSPRGVCARARAGLLGGVAPVGFLQMLTDYLKSEQTFIVSPQSRRCVWRRIHSARQGSPRCYRCRTFGDRFYVFALYDGRT